jgi:hypothetical protein
VSGEAHSLREDGTATGSEKHRRMQRVSAAVTRPNPFRIDLEPSE